MVALRHVKSRNFFPNSKSETLNPKQIQISKFQCSKQCFGFWTLEFRYCLCLTSSIPSRLALRPETRYRGKTRRRERHEMEFRISKLGFNREKGLFYNEQF